MLFNSWVFLLFLAVVLPVYYSLNTRFQNIFLIVASYFFYGYWDYRFLSLIVISTTVNYTIALGIQTAAGKKKKKLLIIGIILNLGFLGFFKYYHFFIDSLSDVFQILGFSPVTSTLKIILPLGISFYTFQAMAYIIDVYLGRQTATKDKISFALFICYFPLLLAGPIERAGHLLPMLQSKRVVRREDVTAGIQLILIGLVKKIAIADAVAPFVNRLYQDCNGHMSLDLLCGVYLFAIQIYGDFSGYSDIARGVSKLLGIDLIMNFRQPYFSKNIVEFWRRWHISLSGWLRDYLYIPMGGNRKGKWKTYRNLMITMLLGGLWHGASWVFVIWGGLHGAYLALHRIFKEITKKEIRENSRSWKTAVITWFSVFVTFHLTSVAWVFFRSPDLRTAGVYLLRLASPANWGYGDASLVQATVFYLLFTFLLDLPQYLADRELLLTAGTHWIWRGLTYAMLMVMISFIGESYVQPFIYFQF
ncbi:MAG: MBOAT family O-acyltransferase [Thermodesulfobacteriota bacterium]